LYQNSNNYLQHKKEERRTKKTMRHPAAPTIITILLGLLLAIVVWSQWRRDGHHEGHPHPDDVPKRTVEDDDTDDGAKGSTEE
jgi:hypothetical protein